MIDRFTKEDLVKLVRKQNDPCVTIYLPTEPTGREIFKAATTLKQLVATARKKLAESWMSDEDAVTFLQPVLEVKENDDFWQETERGLALFLSSGSFQSWRIAKPVPELAIVSDQFFVRPLVSTANNDQKFMILSISRSQAGLFEADESTIRKLDVPGMPENLESALNVSSVDRGSQMHTGSRQYGGKKASVFHGQGGKSETARRDLREYFHRVDQAVSRHLQGSRQPLVLACVSDQAPIYRDINNYAHLSPQLIAGNADELTEHQLRERGWPCMEEYLKQARQSAINDYQASAHTARTLSEVSAILKAAHSGQIETLLVNETASLAGQFDPANQTLDYAASKPDFDKDLIEAAIAQTLLCRGEVIALPADEMPNSENMVATLRY